MAKLVQFWMVARHYIEAETKEPATSQQAIGAVAMYQNDVGIAAAKRGPRQVFTSRAAALAVATALAGRTDDPGHYVVLEAVELVGPPKVVKVVVKEFDTEVPDVAESE